MICTADFETTTDVDDCRVWAWAVCDIDTNEVQYGTDIDTFMKHVEDNLGTYYFHNLAFDGEFIINWLLRNGFEHSERLSTKTFQTLISDMGKFYQLKVCFERKGKKKSKSAVFKDSLKKLPMSVKAVAESFKLEESKLELDYKEAREIGHELTEHEKEYIRADVVIVAKALKVQLSQGLDALTNGSDALNGFKDVIGKNRFRNLFPSLSVTLDTHVRKAYKGGYTYCNPRYAGRVVGEGRVYDVNSMYPWVMAEKPLPVGYPVYFKGEYKDDPSHPLAIQFLTADCKLKPGMLPTLQIKHSPFFMGNVYIEDTEGFVELAMTNVDLKILYEHYDVEVLSFNGGYKFSAQTGVFVPYIDKWMRVKENSEGGIRLLAKLMLNSLYGKFATNPVVKSKVPYLKEDGSIGYKVTEPEERDPVYTPVAVFVTAWARDRIIRSAQAVYDRFLYCDTDSLHVLGDKDVEGLDVHPTKLGCWKHESDFRRGKYIRAKTYMEDIVRVGKVVDGEYTMVPKEYLDVKCAGLPQSLKDQCTFENFEPGLALDGKLVPNHVSGGIVLSETRFTMR